jgi:hypothetical protein
VFRPHVQSIQHELNLSTSCMLSCLRSAQDNSNKISQTNNSTPTTQVQHDSPTNNKPNPQLVIATLQSTWPKLPLSRTRAASKSSTRRQNVFIASPGFSSCLPTSLPALLPSIALFLFPLPLLFLSPFFAYPRLLATKYHNGWNSQTQS